MRWFCVFCWSFLWGPQRGFVRAFGEVRWTGSWETSSVGGGWTAKTPWRHAPFIRKLALTSILHRIWIQDYTGNSLHSHLCSTSPCHHQWTLWVNSRTVHGDKTIHATLYILICAPPHLATTIELYGEIHAPYMETRLYMHFTFSSVLHLTLPAPLNSMGKFTRK